MEEEIEYELVKRNCLFKFDDDVEYKDLVPVFPELLDKFMHLADQYPEEGGEEYMEMLIRLNLRDLTKNQKPMGHNREARYRLIFPREREGVQFFIYPRISHEESEEEIEDVVEGISELLEENDLEHELIWDEMEFLLKEKKK